MTFEEFAKAELPHEASNVVWAMKKAWDAGMAEEREKCANVCDGIANKTKPDDFALDAVNEVADAIRARSNVQGNGQAGILACPS